MYELTVASSHILRNPRMALFTVAAVTLAVAVIVVFMGLLSGFEQEIITSTVENNPHIYVQPKEDETYIYLYRTVSSFLWNYPGVEAVSARLSGKAGAKYKDKVRGVEFLGVDPADENRLMKVEEDIVAGDFQDLRSRKHSAFIGTKLAEELKLDLEDDFILARGNQSARLRVAGLFETGSARDKSQIYIPLSTAQDLVGKGDVVSQVDARVEDIYQAPYIVSHLSTFCSGVTSPLPWRPTFRAARKASNPHPQPRSRTICPSFKPAIAVGFPQPCVTAASAGTLFISCTEYPIDSACSKTSERFST